MSIFGRGLVLLTACLIQVVICQQDDGATSRAINNDLRCYICQESATQGCRDPIDTTYLEKHNCNTLNYEQLPRSTGTNAVPVNNPLLRDVFGSRERFPNRIDYEFECIKFVENNGVERTCVPRPINIEDACDYFKKEKPEVKSCNTCKTHDCNGSSTIRHSVLMISIATLILLRLC